MIYFFFYRSSNIRYMNPFAVAEIANIQLTVMKNLSNLDFDKINKQKYIEA